MLPLEVVPQKGIQLSLDAFDVVRLESGDKTLLSDVENRDNLLFTDASPLKEFFARYLRTTDTKVLFELRADDEKHTELISKSKPLDRKRGIPAKVKQRLQNAYTDFQEKAKQKGVTEEAREFISSLRLADPQESPELYRTVKHKGETRLVVLWGVVRKDSSQMYPLDAINRIPAYRSGWLLKSLAALLSLIGLCVACYFLFDKFPWRSEPLDPLRSNTDKPPFLVVQPRAIEQGGTIEIVPRNKGVLKVYNSAGVELLKRNAIGVEDREALRIFTVAARQVVFTPDNKKFPEEQLGMIIYASPEIRETSVRLSFPEGVNFSKTEIDWDDGKQTTTMIGNETKIVHKYEASGEFVIKIRPNAELAWAAIEFPISIPASH